MSYFSDYKNNSRKQNNIMQLLFFEKKNDRNTFREIVLEI